MVKLAIALSMAQGSASGATLQGELVTILKLYAVTIGWAVAGGIGMGLGLIIVLKIFTFMTKDVNEWDLIKANNIPMGIVLGAVILGTSLVIAFCAKP